MMIEVEDVKYNLETNYKDAFVKEEFVNLWTDYFKDFDFMIVIMKKLKTLIILLI